MNVLIFGAGSIGSIYGYFLTQAGHSVTHYVRANRQAQLKDGLKVNLLDGRDDKQIKTINDLYDIKTITKIEPHSAYDLILVSIKHGSLEPVLEILKVSEVKGDILFFNGLWSTFEELDTYLPRENYLWGYPVAGGNIHYDSATLQGALLDHIQLGEVGEKKVGRLVEVQSLFQSAGIKTEVQENILHWIWVHMAINAGVISTCLKVGSADAFMDQTKAMREGIMTIRETLEIVKFRGVDLTTYEQDTKMFYYPSWISSILLKYFFKKNILARQIMSLHNNLEDLYELCSDVYDTGEKAGINMPLFERKSNLFLA